jgi:hypothetical protein
MENGRQPLADRDDAVRVKPFLQEQRVLSFFKSPELLQYRKASLASACFCQLWLLPCAPSRHGSSAVALHPPKPIPMVRPIRLTMTTIRNQFVNFSSPGSRRRFPNRFEIPVAGLVCGLLWIYATFTKSVTAFWKKTERKPLGMEEI